MMSACLSREGCARHLSDAARVANLTNSSAPGGLKIHLEVASDMPGIAVVKALASALDIGPGYIGLVSRAGPRFAFVITVHPDIHVQSLINIIRTLTTVVVTGISVVAAVGTATATTTMMYIDLPNTAWITTELEKIGRAHV